MLLLQLLSSLSMSRISVEASVYGENAIAAMGVVLRIVTLGTNVVFGYMKGFQPLAGFNYGAKNYSRLKKAVKSCIQWTTVFCLIWTGLIFLLASPILSFFSDDSQLLHIAVPALKANVMMFFSFGFQFTYLTLYLAMGKALAGGFFKRMPSRNYVYSGYFYFNNCIGLERCCVYPGCCRFTHHCCYSLFRS